MMKHKRLPTSLLPVRLAYGFVLLTTIYAAIALFQIDHLFSWYATVAGIAMTFFWCFVAGSVGLTLLMRHYRMHSQPVKAQAIRLVLIGFGILGAGTVSVAITAFSTTA